MSAERLIGGPLTVDEAAAAGEPRSLIRRFWEGLARGQTEVVEEVMREISPPTISAFSFGEDDDWAAAEVTALGTLPLKVHVDTPTAVVKSWNLEKKVRMV